MLKDTDGSNFMLWWGIIITFVHLLTKYNVLDGQTV